MENTLKRPFGFHWLAHLGVLNPGDGKKLTNAVRLAKNAGCNVFELVGPPMNNMSALETAQALKAGGITHAVYCRFFPEDGSLGNPAGEKGSFEADLAIRTFQSDLDFIRMLRHEGINVTVLDGPSCFQIGFDYTKIGKEEFLKRAIAFYRYFVYELRQLGLIVALEYLREGESVGAVETLEDVGTISDAFVNPETGHRVIRWHADVYHMQMRRVDACKELRKGEALLAYLHAHGTDRVPPGATEIDEDPEQTDRTNWSDVFETLDEIEYAGIMTPEPFGDAIREIAPALGANLPGALPAERYYSIAYNTFARQQGE